MDTEAVLIRAGAEAKPESIDSMPSQSDLADFIRALPRGKKKTSALSKFSENVSSSSSPHSHKVAILQVSAFYLHVSFTDEMLSSTEAVEQIGQHLGFSQSQRSQSLKLRKSFRTQRRLLMYQHSA